MEVTAPNLPQEFQNPNSGSIPEPPNLSHFQHPNQTRNLKGNTPIPSTGVNTEGLPGTGFAISNKWIATVPLQNVLGPKFHTIELMLASFTLPSIEMGSNTIAYRSNNISVPSHVMQPDTKEITFNYIIRDDWMDYRSLYSWCMNLAPINKGTISKDSEIVANGLYLTCDIRVELIDHYKRSIIAFIFKNCWIKSFSDLQLSYANADEVTHSFTCSYTNFELEDLPELTTRIEAVEGGKTELDNSIEDFKLKAKEEFIARYGHSM